MSTKIIIILRFLFGKNFSGKYSQKALNHAKQSATDKLKTT